MTEVRFWKHRMPCIAGRFFTIWATREAHLIPSRPQITIAASVVIAWGRESIPPSHIEDTLGTQVPQHSPWSSSPAFCFQAQSTGGNWLRKSILVDGDSIEFKRSEVSQTVEERKQTFSIYRELAEVGSKITADSDCSHEIKRCLLFERKVWPT